MRRLWRTRRVNRVAGSSTGFRPPANAPVSRIGGHLRRGIARLSGTRRRARPYHDGGRDARRCTRWQERPACSCRFAANARRADVTERGAWEPSCRGNWHCQYPPKAAISASTRPSSGGCRVMPIEPKSERDARTKNPQYKVIAPSSRDRRPPQRRTPGYAYFYP